MLLPAWLLLAERPRALPVCRPLAAGLSLALLGRVVTALGGGGALCPLRAWRVRTL